MIKGWSALIRERFNPLAYGPMILLFTAANAFYLTSSQNSDWSWARFIPVLILLTSFFLRLRIFDEIKDYATDLRINPHRPLARGALTVRQARVGLLVLLILEFALSASLGFWPFIIHLIAVLFSLLMFEEFFVGDWIRPHLTTYAMTHTFVSVLAGLSAGVAMTGFDPRLGHLHLAQFFLMNWAFFNLFEFARKTFATEEERPTVDSYSRIFGSRGAVVLAISQAAAGNLLLYRSFENPLMHHLASRMPFCIALLALYVLTCLPYFAKPTLGGAKIFRTSSSLYLLLHYGAVLFVLGGS